MHSQEKELPKVKDCSLRDSRQNKFSRGCTDLRSLRPKTRLVLGSGTTHPHGERCWVPCLQEYGPRPGEFTDKTFTRADTRDDAAACDTFHDVFAVPGDEMAVVDDVLFAILEL